MNVIYNNRLISTIEIPTNYTVANLKQYIRDLIKEKNPYSLELILNDNKTIISPEVFNTSMYDNVTFDSMRDKIKGSNLIVSSPIYPTLSPPTLSPPKQPQPTLDLMDKNLIQQMAMTMNYPDIMALCNTSHRYKAILCDDENFWKRKLKQDYPNTEYLVGPSKAIYEWEYNSVWVLYHVNGIDSDVWGVYRTYEGMVNDMVEQLRDDFLLPNGVSPEEFKDAVIEDGFGEFGDGSYLLFNHNRLYK